MQCLPTGPGIHLQAAPFVGTVDNSTTIDNPLMADNNPADRARAFHALHVKGNPVVLFNIWDAGSARAVADSGARALATGSWSVAAAMGYADGQAVPLQAALDNLKRIVANVSLPVTIDLEAGYGHAPEVVGETVAAALAAGAIGCNLEDQVIGGVNLYSIDEQARRLSAARAAAERAGIPAYLNARTDIFLKAPPEAHDQKGVDEALERAQAYAAAGASGLFVPGLVDEKWIGTVCDKSPLPVNVMWLPALPPTERLAQLGVSRISHGPGPYVQTMRALKDAASRIYGA